MDEIIVKEGTLSIDLDKIDFVNQIRITDSRKIIYEGLPIRSINLESLQKGTLLKIYVKNNDIWHYYGKVVLSFTTMILDDGKISEIKDDFFSKLRSLLKYD